MTRPKLIVPRRNRTRLLIIAPMAQSTRRLMRIPSTSASIRAILLIRRHIIPIVRSPGVLLHIPPPPRVKALVAIRAMQQMIFVLFLISATQRRDALATVVPAVIRWDVVLLQVVASQVVGVGAPRVVLDAAFFERLGRWERVGVACEPGGGFVWVAEGFAEVEVGDCGGCCKGDTLMVVRMCLRSD
jgi:hypothetical protein